MEEKPGIEKMRSIKLRWQVQLILGTNNTTIVQRSL